MCWRVVLVVAAFLPPFVSSADGEVDRLVRISSHLTVCEGSVSGAFLERDGRRLVVYGDPRAGAPPAELVLFTHHRRDVVEAGRGLVERGAHAVVPASEKELFTEAGKFWREFTQKRFHDYAQQSTKILTRPLPVTRTVKKGERIEWNGFTIKVLSTPGYTRGAVSYVARIDGLTVAFTGDLIYGDGRIFDLYSLQDAVPEAGIAGYHGYAARAAQVLSSLVRIKDAGPDLLIPARGPVIRDPGAAIERLSKKLRRLYANYLSIDALRWYFHDSHIMKKARRILGFSTKIDRLERAEVVNEKPPPWIVPFGTSRLLVARDRSSFLIDCGGKGNIDTVKRFLKEGRIKSVDGLYLTHYHDDHTDAADSFAREFHCPVYASEKIKDILENPGAYRMPAETANPVRSVRGMAEGSVLRWKEFTLRFSFFPGQTLYHGGLLVTRDTGERIFFIGDSFTPCGIDDYCLLNRNLLHPGEGYFYCLKVLKEMPQDYLLINEHVIPTFRFSRSQIERMETVLKRRVEILRDLLPWDDPNYGIDERWVRFYPYGQKAGAGETIELKLVVRNHSAVGHRVEAEVNLPRGWRARRERISFAVEAGREGEGLFELTIPADCPPSTAVVTADVSYAGRRLAAWPEALVIVGGGACGK